ncbi:F-box associated interaction domain [Arabidopsis suecica]|uniref:F-box associated interaction domain n=1 Tax=Arabidopsis suecica TaxID=45249 RepID=A0A8T1Z5U9_ARASU|nr:F-box associated interaction domain [Arabidopsis suecica]
MSKRKRVLDDIISNTSLVELPQDVVGEILEKLPMKSLLRFKAASKLETMEKRNRNPAFPGETSKTSAEISRPKYPDLDGQTNTCEVFSFDTNNSWRYDVIVSSPHPILHHKVPAHAHGSLHWFTDTITETQVLSFDLHTETFTVMANIPVADAPHERITMCTLNDRLCISEDKGDTQTIWSLNQANMTWHKTYSINLRATLSCIEEEYLNSWPPITSLFNNRLLLYDCSDD